MIPDSTLLQLPPLSLYVHVPWCVRKCPYCDFNSHAQRGELPEAEYLDALISDLDQEVMQIQGRRLESIFIGGGTPSLMSGDFYHSLLAAIADRIPCSPQMEVTLEANPGTFEQARFAAFRAAGINRLSIGVQSFADPQLAALGRIHSSGDAVKAAKAAKELGFDRLNIDIMHGLPDQSIEQALADLHQAMELEPSHLSWYQLTIEPNTEFHSRPPVIPKDEILWDIQEQGQQLLARAGFQQYEISAYARHQDRCRHNLNYWQFGDYLGIGAGAHGKVTDLSLDQDKGQVIRRWKQRQPKAYMCAPAEAKQQVIDVDALPLEFLMNALRLNQGVPAQMFSQRTGLPLTAIEVQLKTAREQQLLVADESVIAPTEKGHLFLNELLERFF